MTLNLGQGSSATPDTQLEAVMKTEDSKKRAKRGRPFKPNGEARTMRMLTRVNVDEHHRISALADEVGLSVSAYLRVKGLEENIIPQRSDVDAKILYELNRCGVNLHQIVRGMNFGHGIPSDIADVLDELKAATAKVAEAYDP